MLNGARLTPTLEIGARHDGGDAEKGSGVDVGAGFVWADSQHGLEVEVRGRGLLVHQDAELRDIGWAASLTWDRDPASDRGPWLALRQTMGAPADSGAGALLSRETLAGFPPGNEPGGRFETRLGYGLAALGGRFTGTPELGFRAVQHPPRPQPRLAPVVRPES